MKKHYFELDQVHSITFSMERDSEYIWKEAVPPRPKKFLGITIGTKPAIPAGWSEYQEEEEYEMKRRKQSSYFDDYDWYRVDEKAKKIFIKPHVDVRFGHKEGIGCRYETNEEAQAWIDELIQSSDKQFHVIINK